VGEARTAPGHGLVPLGAYVALVEATGQATDVAGELFEVEEALLPVLDEFEGDDYERRAVTLDREGTGNGMTALAYFRSERLNDR
jgi:gamma-glutamylcyclotransferase (GGCT)/AIG2-like uncharacterized protein YtfP